MDSQMNDLLTEKRCSGCGQFFNIHESDSIRKVCLECHEVYCDECSECHQSTEDTSGHRLVTYRDDNKTRTTTKRQNGYTQDPCLRHTEKQVSSLCQTCVESICDTCKTTTHGEHVVVPLHKIRDTCRREMQELSANASSYVSKLQKTLREVKGKRDALLDLDMTEKQNVREYAKHLKIEIDEVRDEILDQLDRKRKENKKRIVEYEESTENLLTHIEATQETADYVLRNGTDSQTAVLSVHLRTKFDESVRQNKELSFETHGFTFVEDKSRIRELFDNYRKVTRHDISNSPLLQFKMTRKLSFVSQKNPFTICPVSGQEAWIVFDIRQTILMYNTKGNVTKRNMVRRPGVDDACFALNGILLCTTYNARMISALDVEENSVKTFCKLTCRARGICYRHLQKDVIVTGDNGKRICFIDDEGNVTREIQNFINNYQFSDLDRLTSTPSGLICITDRPDDEMGSVLFLSPEGEVEFIYKGKEHTLDRFQPSGICSDQKGFVFISDSENHCVHVVDTKVWTSQIILTEKDGVKEPLGIAVDPEGALWVGNLDGKINVFEYSFR